MIIRTIVTLDKNTMLKFYKSLLCNTVGILPFFYVRFQICNPYLKQDMEELEKVQRRATQMIQGCRDMNYEKGLKRCGLTTLEKTRSRADLTEAYKIITSIDLQWEFLELAPNKVTRRTGNKYSRKGKGTLGQQ